MVLRTVLRNRTRTRIYLRLTLQGSCRGITEYIRCIMINCDLMSTQERDAFWLQSTVLNRVPLRSLVL